MGFLIVMTLILFYFVKNRSKTNKKRDEGFNKVLNHEQIDLEENLWIIQENKLEIIQLLILYHDKKNSNYLISLL